LIKLKINKKKNHTNSPTQVQLFSFDKRRSTVKSDQSWWV